MELFVIAPRDLICCQFKCLAPCKVAEFLVSTIGEDRASPTLTRLFAIVSAGSASRCQDPSARHPSLA
jgi:hypothetical protein